MKFQRERNTECDSKRERERIYDLKRRMTKEEAKKIITKDHSKHKSLKVESSEARERKKQKRKRIQK